VDSNRFQTLLDAYVSRTTTAAETVDLENLLQADAGLRRQFAERLLLEVHLRKAFAAIGPAVPLASGRRRGRRVMVGWLVAASLLISLSGGLLAWLVRGPGQPSQRAAVQAANDVLTGEVHLDGVAVKQLPEEQWFEVAVGAPALIRLADGGRVEIAPASKALIHGRHDKVRQAVELERGSGKFSVPAGAGQFRVETAVGNVTVLGTEFSVTLESRARGEGKRSRSRTSMTVVVTEGSVTVDSGGKSYVVGAGERRVFPERMKREDDD
jgi:hypothetical protein